MTDVRFVRVRLLAQISHILSGGSLGIKTLEVLEAPEIILIRDRWRHCPGVYLSSACSSVI